MTRGWVRPTGAPGPMGVWHYVPSGYAAATFFGPRRVACDVLIDADNIEGRGDEPGREIPAPACPTCWLARQAVEAYRRSLVPDPAQVATIQRITQDLEDVRRVSFGLNDDVLRLQRAAAELAQAIAYREAS